MKHAVDFRVAILAAQLRSSIARVRFLGRYAGFHEPSFSQQLVFGQATVADFLAVLEKCKSDVTVNILDDHVCVDREGGTYELDGKPIEQPVFNLTTDAAFSDGARVCRRVYPALVELEFAWAVDDELAAQIPAALLQESLRKYDSGCSMWLAGNVLAVQTGRDEFRELLSGVAIGDS